MVASIPVRAFALTSIVFGYQALTADPHVQRPASAPAAHLIIQCDESALTALRLDPRRYVNSVVTEGRTIWRAGGLHLKGQYGTFQSAAGKPSLTLNFDRLVADQKFHGLDKL